MKFGLRHDFVVPDLLRTGLWGWSWSKKEWPGKRRKDDLPVKKEKQALDHTLLDDPSAIHFLVRARFLVSCEEYEQALADYNQVIHEKPNDPKVYAERSDLHLLMHHDQEALNDLLFYAMNFPNDTRADLKLSYIYLLLGDFAEGQFFLRQYEERAKPDPNAKLLAQYILNFKRRMHIELGVADIHLKEEYSEKNLLNRAQIKERAFDLVGAAEEYLMLYLLFERDEYQQNAERIKGEIMERHRRRIHSGR